MLVKVTSVALIAGMLISASSLPNLYQPQTFMNLENTRLIECQPPDSKFVFMGTGFMISQDIMVTANHVVENGPCFDSKTAEPIQIYYRSTDKDVALVRFHVDAREFQKYSCAGFKRNREYMSIGFKNGTDFVITKVVGTRYKSDMKGQDTFRDLKGDIYHGMSGGPIIDSKGYVVGINIATDGEGMAGARPLTETILCKNSKI